MLFFGLLGFVKTIWLLPERYILKFVLLLLVELVVLAVVSSLVKITLFLSTLKYSNNDDCFLGLGTSIGLCVGDCEVVISACGSTGHGTSSQSLSTSSII